MFLVHGVNNVGFESTPNAGSNASLVLRGRPPVSFYGVGLQFRFTGSGLVFVLRGRPSFSFYGVGLQFRYVCAALNVRRNIHHKGPKWFPQTWEIL